MANDWFLLLIPQSFGLGMASYPLMMWKLALYEAWNDLNGLYDVWNDLDGLNCLEQGYKLSFGAACMAPALLQT